jgi:hypothetical protein
MLRLPTLALSLLALAPFAHAAEARPDAVRYDAHGLIIDGKPTQVYSGAFHYYRCPKPLWRERFQKIKEAGFNAVETYVSWNVHESQPPADPKDFSKIDMTDLVDWMRMAHDEFGLNTIIRPGPYICAEWQFGGYPRWLYTKFPAKAANGRPAWLRSDDPSYLDWSQHWMDAVCKVVVPEQVSRKPAGAKGVILFQIENEYDYWGMPDDAKVTHLKRLHRDARAAGITVPIFTCWTHNARNSTDVDLADTFDAVNLYNRTDIAGASKNMRDARKSQPGKPGMVAELQGGWFANVGGQLSEDQGGLDAPQINAITMAAIAHGASITNFYMLFGGSHFGPLAGRDKPATYDYNAPIRESGAVGDRYAKVKGIGAMLAQWGDSLVVADPVAVAKSEGGDGIEFVVKRNPAGESFVFAFNKDRKTGKSGAATLTLADGASLKVAYNLEGFGYQVCRLASGESDTTGKKWLPEPGALPKRPDSASLPKPIRITEEKIAAIPLPASGWKPFVAGTPLPNLGVYDQFPVAYRAAVTLSEAEAKNLSGLAVDMFADDRVVARVNGVTLATEKPGSKKAQNLDVRGLLKPGANTVEIVYEDLASSNWDHSMENRYGVKAARLAVAPPVVNLADWRSRLVADVAEGRKLAAQPDDGKGESFTLDAITLDELNGVHQPGADLTRVAAAKILTDKKAVALFRSTVDIKESDLRSGLTRFVFECLDDKAEIFVNGKPLGKHANWAKPFAADAAKLLHAGKNDIAVVVSNADGAGGITKPVRLEGAPASAARELALEWTTIPTGFPTPAEAKTVALDTTAPVPAKGSAHPNDKPGEPLVRHEVSFDLPAETSGVWLPWNARIEASGNGQLYLNGHHIGRYWQAGMQRSFFLPGCWLKPGARNTLVLEQLATDSGNALRAVEIVPAVEQAEVR